MHKKRVEKTLHSQLSTLKIYTNPEKPIKAIARIDAVINAIGTPWKAFGASSNSMRSRKPAKITNAKPKPNAVATL